MTATISFQMPLVWQAGLPLAGALLALAAWRQHRRGLRPGPILALAALRLAVFAALFLLASRPVVTEKNSPDPNEHRVLVLLDRSESMSIRDQNETRFAQAARFLEHRLMGALRQLGLAVDTVLFAESAEPLASGSLAQVNVNGRRTNLGGAIAHSLGSSPRPPVALIALTDGHANDNRDNARGWSALSENRTPFIAVGFGSDQGARSLSLRAVDAPQSVAANTSFQVSAQLEMLGSVPLPPVQVLLLRNGELLQTRTLEPGAGSRIWLESFQLTEHQAGTHSYTVQLLLPADESLKSPNLAGSTAVRVEDQRPLRVLYLQGALTWDYKFVSLALRQDPSMRITGLVRTSEKSLFRQNVEAAGELLNGFPQSLDELAPFRVVVLSNLRPADLTGEQQELLRRFCAERGGGVLLLGGPATLNLSWRGSPLEKLLPVTFAAPSPGPAGLDRPFRPELTRAGRAHPVFRLNEQTPPDSTWNKLPPFADYARVEAPKPGAEVWAVHPADHGPSGRRTIIATQRYGAGIATVICVQNFWRWRLAPDHPPAEHDRFWRQLFRYLSEAGRQEVSVDFAQQQLQPHTDIHVLLALQPNPSLAPDASRQFTVSALNPRRQLLREQTVHLTPAHPSLFSFPAGQPDLYTVTVSDAAKIPVASRTVEIRAPNQELENTARDMENLRQWAGASGGLALRAEDCPDAADLLATIRDRIGRPGQPLARTRPAGINAWVLTPILALLAAEWLLRRKWGLA